MIPPLGEPNQLQCLKGAFPPLRALHASIDERQLDIFDGIRTSEEVESLEDKAEIIAAQPGALLSIERSDIDAAKQIRGIVVARGASLLDLRDSFAQIQIGLQRALF